MSHQWYSISCPAKLNLLLHITGRRDDGYHNLQTLFQLLDFGDNLSIRLREDNEIELQTPIPGVSKEDNLVVKAIRLIQQASGITQGCDVRLEKQLPMGGGIGGGSSDAGSALLLTNFLFGTPLPLKTLRQIGLTLGADVPVFVNGRSAWAEGVGEKLQAVELPEKWFLIIHPNIHISTANIFSHTELTRNSPLITIRTALAEGGRNDCENVVRSLYPEVDAAINWLNQYSPAMLTGTGACIFAAFESFEHAQKIAEKIPQKWNHFVAKAANISMAHRELADFQNKTG